MPNVKNMNDRFQSHLARVSGKALAKESERIQRLLLNGKISPVTATHMHNTAPIRLAWLAQ